MTKKKIAIFSKASLITIYLSYRYFSTATDGEIYLMSKVKKDNFISKLIIFGEAKSISLEKINGPDNLRKHKV